MTAIEKLPEKSEAEKKLCGSILLLPEILPEVRRIVAPTDFFCGPSRLVYQTFDRMAANGDPIERESVLEVLRDRSEFPDGAATFLIECTTGVGAAYNAAHYAKLVKDASIRRQAIGVGEHLIAGAMNGHTTDTVLNEAWAGIEDIRRVSVGETPAFPMTTAAELAVANYPITYIVDRLLVEQQFCILGGPKKALKTTLAIVLAICIALGVPFLGQSAISRRRRVLICSCESGMATIKDIALRVCAWLGVQLEDIDNLAFTPNVPKPANAKSWGEFCQTVEGYRPDVLILDALYRLLSGDGAENLFKMAVPLDTIDSFCRSLDITPIVCHHLKTGRINQYDPADMDDLAYSGAAEFMRQGIMLTRREQYEPGSGIHRLWLNVGGSAGHNSLWALDAFEGSIDDPGGRRWETALVRADEAREAAQQRRDEAKATEAEKQLDDDRTAVCRVLVKHPSGLTQTNIRDRAGISGRRWPTVLATMLERSELAPVDIITGNQKTPRTGYKLNESEVS